MCDCAIEAALGKHDHAEQGYTGLYLAEAARWAAARAVAQKLNPRLFISDPEEKGGNDGRAHFQHFTEAASLIEECYAKRFGKGVKSCAPQA